MKVYTIGGYDECGKNMMAIEVDKEIVIFDMGYHMEKIVQHNHEIDTMALSEIMEVGAIPNDKIINNQRKKVKAIVLNHGHLDHIGAVPFLARAYKCPIICTPYTADLVRKLINSNNKKVTNPIVELKSGGTYEISKNLEIEFIPVTHSIPDTVISILRTKEGNVWYANDFKLDDSPTLGAAVDYRRFKKLASEGVKVLFLNTVHVDDDKSCPSELEAHTKLKNTFRRISQDGLIIGTTFASQIARLNSFIKLNKDRKVVMLGRSLHDYVLAAQKRDLINLDNVEVYSRRNDLVRVFKEATKRKNEYLLLCTGNQGEPYSVLRRIGEGILPISLSKEDSVIFSCSVIPVLPNMHNRHLIEGMLHDRKVEMFKDVHASGHAFREDLRYFLRLVDPEHLIPCHNTAPKQSSLVKVAYDYGYELNKDVHVSQNGKVLKI